MEKASITLTEAHHALAHEAIDAGEYASLSELIREALREWEHKRHEREAALESLRAEIMKGVKDVEEGRVTHWDPEEQKRRIREKWANR